MDDLICQAFLHVDAIGQLVQAHHYDLMGPDGEIILPQVWEAKVEPGMAVSMHMWPMEEPECRTHDPQPKEIPPRLYWIPRAAARKIPLMADIPTD